jgi:DNA mismatch repair protein MutL
MSNIHLLDEVTINKIAAGEVIERPSSVVKELIENALDADARRVDIKIISGGRELIQVIDDGNGMDREDAIKSLERHATSKINTDQDLQTLSSLGFRGEALPSIASVSRFKLETCMRGSVEGTSINCEGGRILGIETAGVPSGTRISVRDLYYNTPARLKFMKTIPTEMSHIKETVSCLALAHPNVSFSLLHDESELLFCTGDGRTDHTLASIFGNMTIKNLIPIESGNWGPLTISGYIGRPEIARPNRNQQIIIINHRWIRSRTISAAVEKAYRTYLPIARFPFFFLDIQIDPALIDVNVHPAKTEVRFLGENEVFRGVYHLVNAALNEKMSVISGTEIRPASQRKQNKQDLLSSYDPAYKAPATSKYVKYPTTESKKTVPLFVSEEAVSSNIVWIPPIKNDNDSINETKIAGHEDSFKKSQAKIDGFGPYLVFDDTFLVTLCADGIILTDQHAAHERVLYEKYLQREANNVGEGQLLLEPIVIELSPDEIEIASRLLDELRLIGFELDWFGEETLIVRSVPNGISVTNATVIFHQLIDDIKLTGESKTSIKERIITTLACRTAIKAGDKLTAFEAKKLLEDLAECKNPFNCPHGRPTQIRLDHDELYRLFRRV